MGIKNHPLYQTWKGMRYRCNYKKNRAYSYYGGSGIKVCPRWNNSFLNFIEDMGERPSDKHSLDRIDSTGDYEPSNCRWATRQEQTDNRRIAYECHKGHPWTEESTIWTHNGKGKTRRCKICFLQKNRKPESEGGVNG